METASTLSTSLSSQHFFIIVLLTVLFLFLALFAVQLLPLSPKIKLVESDDVGADSSEKENENDDEVKGTRCCCTCHCNGSVHTVSSNSEPNTTQLLNGCGSLKTLDRSPIVTDRHTGASMMEQLVPEITTHALSYLDYTSLCRLSMTNSLMRKAANDDNAWKALYHNDFTLEQDTIRPIGGWKAYYAATRAIVNINTEFFNIIRERSLSAMSRFWLNADFVKCVRASGELFSGYSDVIQSWQFEFNWEQDVNFQVRDVRARVLTKSAWVTMKAYLEVDDSGPFNMTNVFELQNGWWYMVHHHCSVMDPDVEHPIVHGGCVMWERGRRRKGVELLQSLPGFGWWPIKAYRPCPSFWWLVGIKRGGQNMDEVVSGRGKRATSKETGFEVKSSKIVSMSYLLT